MNEKEFTFKNWSAILKGTSLLSDKTVSIRVFTLMMNGYISRKNDKLIILLDEFLIENEDKF